MYVGKQQNIKTQVQLLHFSGVAKDMSLAAQLPQLVEHETLNLGGHGFKPQFGCHHVNGRLNFHFAAAQTQMITQKLY